jgi:hypothetical protein
MRSVALAAAIAAALAAAQSRTGRAAMDGFVTRDEALAILETPLEESIGRDEAVLVQRVAVATALLEHCRLDWDRLFQALTRTTAAREGVPKRRWAGSPFGTALGRARRSPSCAMTAVA